MTTSHLTAQPVLVAGRFNRQRCAWCGELIVDEDLTMMLSTEPEWEGTEWPAHRIVRIDGPHTMLVPEGDGDSRGQTKEMPDDSCMARTVASVAKDERNATLASPKLSLV